MTENKEPSYRSIVFDENVDTLTLINAIINEGITQENERIVALLKQEIDEYAKNRNGQAIQFLENIINLISPKE